MLNPLSLALSMGISSAMNAANTTNTTNQQKQTNQTNNNPQSLLANLSNAAKGLKSAANTARATTQQMDLQNLIAALNNAPKAPTYDLQYQAPQRMSYGEAYNQASQRVNPQIEQAKNKTMQTYAQQRKLLPQYLNARGQLYGGLRMGGESGLTQKQAQALDELAVQGEQMKANAASAIQDQDYSQATEQARAMYQQQVDNARMAQDTWTQNMSKWMSDRNLNYDALKYALDTERADKASELASNQWQQTFDFNKENADYNRERQQGLDEFDLRKWTSSFTGIDPETGEKSWSRLQDEFANQLAKARGTSSTGGGGSSAKTTKPTFGQLAQGVSALASDLLKPFVPNTNTSGLPSIIQRMIPTVPVTRTPDQVFNLLVGQIFNQAGAAGMSSTDLDKLINIAAKQSGVSKWVKPDDKKDDW